MSFNVNNQSISQYLDLLATNTNTTNYAINATDLGLTYQILPWYKSVGTGTNSNVNAIAIDSSNNIYVGGGFTLAGGVANTTYIARWNGLTWSALGTGTNGAVNAIAIDSANNVYVGGSFPLAGGVANTAYIARWNGTAWSALGTGMNNSVTAIAIDSANNVYAGGGFTLAGGITGTARIARWNGTAWSALGTGTNGTVRTIAIDSANDVYAGGGFTTAGGVSTNYIAKWTVSTSTWSTLGTGVASSSVRGIAINSANNLYAVGEFTSAGGVANTAYIAQWNGTAWSALETGMSNIVYSIAIDSANNVYAGGSFTSAGGVAATRIAKWNGSVWSAVGTGVNSFILSIAINSANELYVGGAFTKTAEGVVDISYVTNIVAPGSTNYLPITQYKKNDEYIFNYKKHSPLGTGMDNWVYDIAIDSAKNVYAVGNFTSAGGQPNTLRIAKWTVSTSTWSALGTGGINGSVYTIAIASNNNIYVGGGNITLAGGVAVKNIAIWNGSTWSNVVGGGTGAINNNIYAIAIDSNNNIYVGGDFTSIGGITANRIAKLSGSTWSALGTGTSDTVTTIAIDSANNLWVGGSFTTAGGLTANRIAKYTVSSSTWSAIISGTNGVNNTVNTIAIDSVNNVYVGGNFTTAGAISASRIARWGGLSWSALGTGMNNTVNTIAIDSENNVYAGGNYTNAGGVKGNNYIAKWNGTAWSVVGTGLNNNVYIIQINSANDVYVGGDFTLAGGVAINRICELVIKPYF